MIIFITGSSGFIGRALVEHFSLGGHEVHGCDRRPPSCRDVLSLKKADIHGASVVIHAAAQATIADNWSARSVRQELTRSNVLATEHLLEILPESVGRFVFFSTGNVYGDTIDGREDRYCPAVSPYAASKLAGEAMVQAYARQRGFAWTIFRPSVVVGSSLRRGTVWDFVHSVRDHGEVRAKGSGTFRKSAVALDDVVEAVDLAVKNKLCRGVYNLASGLWSPQDTVELMGEMAGKIIPVKWPKNDHGWPGDALAILNAHKLRSAGWEPKVPIRAVMIDLLTELGWPLK